MSAEAQQHGPETKHADAHAPATVSAHPAPDATPDDHKPEAQQAPAHAEHTEHHEPAETEKELPLLKRIVWNIKNLVAKALGSKGHHGNGHAAHGEHGANGGHGAHKDEHDKKDPEKKSVNWKELPNKVQESELNGLKLLLDKFKPEIKQVLYPCCGNDGINKQFPDAHVTYVDMGPVDEYTKAGYDAHQKNILDFKPQHDPDLLVMFNPTLKKEEVNKVAELVKPGKYVLCNDYHSTAQHLHENPDFEFLGIVEKVGTFDGRKGEDKLVTEGLEKYFKKSGKTESPFGREHFEAGGIDDYYFFRRKPAAAKDTSAKPASAKPGEPHQQAA